MSEDDGMKSRLRLLERERESSEAPEGRGCAEVMSGCVRVGGWHNLFMFVFTYESLAR